MKESDTTYGCQDCRIHLHQASAEAMCEVEQGQFLCISCDKPMAQNRSWTEPKLSTASLR